ncbi:MAG: hypothetical protein AMJ79_11900 [Phycisphaerae bacterium SM23_30]|nr:MAG: hypothetical protein AMJ79_11900 [Phycisphaerae bacterium SM23_30]
MAQKNLNVRRGFTITELVITMIIAAIVMLSIGMVLSDSQKAWTRMHRTVFSEAATDTYVARQAFDSVIRRASREKILLGEDGAWIEIYCYQDKDSTEIDHYIRLFESNGSLKIEHGDLEPRTTLSVWTVCNNVTHCVFKKVGRSAQMILTLDDGNQTFNVVSSAVLHN